MFLCGQLLRDPIELVDRDGKLLTAEAITLGLRIINNYDVVKKDSDHEVENRSKELNQVKPEAAEF